tara:strand:+ start:837 stop:1316 length:480 start_codon:yes stop_codon:yes gene_type:complete
MIKAILACDQDWGIGKDGDLPWPHNTEDLKWFKESTIGGVVVMGKSTWNSLPRKPLPNRKNIIITSSEQDKEQDGCQFIKFNIAKKELVNMSKSRDVWIIGGAKLVKGLLDIIDEFHLSRIQGSYDCDTFLSKSLIIQKYELAESGKRGSVYVDIWKQL